LLITNSPKIDIITDEKETKVPIHIYDIFYVDFINRWK